MESVTISRCNQEPMDDNFYKVEDRPPFVFSFLNALQIVVCQVLNIVWLPLLLTPGLCILPAEPIRVYLVSTAFLTAGVVTSLQSTLGIRLPTIAAPSPLYAAGLLSLLRSPAWQCVGGGDLYAMGPSLRAQEWQSRLREVQGALLFAGGLQTLIGFTGLQAWVFQTLSPVSVAPAIILAGLSVPLEVQNHLSSYHWLAISLLILMVFFALQLQNTCLPLPTLSLNSGITAKRFPVFRMFPVLWTCVAVYIFYKIESTFSNLSPPYPNTEVIGFNEAVDNSKWFFFPFPFEWGMPTLSLSTALHILPVVLLQSFTSLITFYANANNCNLGSPPRKAVSRGLGLEGLGLLFGAFWGHGVTSQPTNVGLLSLTGIVSRSSVQLAALILICMSHFTFFTSRLANIPVPFLSALQLYLHACLVCVGVSMLKFINFSNRRDSFITGLSLSLGLLVPRWVNNVNQITDSGLPLLDSFIVQSLSSSVFVGLATGFLLDLLLTGREKKRNTNSWKHRPEEDVKTYRLPTWEELLCSVLEGSPFFSD